jgi:hypothetical protein
MTGQARTMPRASLLMAGEGPGRWSAADTCRLIRPKPAGASGLVRLACRPGPSAWPRAASAGPS